MVPVDRAQLVDELIRRKEAKGISLDLMVERFGDAPDKKAEVEAIWADAQRMLEMEQAIEKLKLEAQAQLQEKQLANQVALADKQAAAQEKAAAARPQPQPGGGNRAK
jgi:hypothetical protein